MLSEPSIKPLARPEPLVDRFLPIALVLSGCVELVEHGALGAAIDNAAPTLAQVVAAEFDRSHPLPVGVALVDGAFAPSSSLGRHAASVPRNVANL